MALDMKQQLRELANALLLMEKKNTQMRGERNILSRRVELLSDKIDEFDNEITQYRMKIDMFMAMLRGEVVTNNASNDTESILDSDPLAVAIAVKQEVQDELIDDDVNASQEQMSQTETSTSRRKRSVPVRKSKTDVADQLDDILFSSSAKKPKIEPQDDDSLLMSTSTPAIGEALDSSVDDTDEPDDQGEHEDEAGGSADRPDRYQCSKCDYKCPLTKTMLRHLTESGHLGCDLSCMECDDFKTTEPWTLAWHYRSQHDASTSIKMSSSGAVKKKKRESTGGPLNCDMCGETFTRSRILEQHLTTVHKLKYQCDHCEKSYTLKRTLQMHVDTKHKGIKPFVCELCGVCFGRREDARNHQKVHLKPYTCSKCDYRAAQQCAKARYQCRYLENHIKKEHPEMITQLGPALKLGPEVLSKLCKSSMRYRKPEKAAKSYTCPKCGKLYKTRAEFEAHFMRNHYECREELETVLRSQGAKMEVDPWL